MSEKPYADIARLVYSRSQGEPRSTSLRPGDSIPLQAGADFLDNQQRLRATVQFLHDDPYVQGTYDFGHFSKMVAVVRFCYYMTC